MTDSVTRGMVYRCNICGAEVTVLVGRGAGFEPRCCNRPMAPLGCRTRFYYCPVCGAEVGVLRVTGGAFEPRCCNREMVLEPPVRAA